MSLAESVYAEVLWESLRDVPTLRFQFIELIEAESLRELGERWGYDPPENVRKYIRGPLRRRLEREAGGEALKYLNLLMGEKAI